MCTIYGVLSHFTIFCFKISFFAIYAVLSGNLFWYDLRAFAWRKLSQKLGPWRKNDKYEVWTLPALHIEDIGETPGAIFETPGTPSGWRFGHIWEANSHSLHPQNVSRVLDIARDTPPPLHLLLADNLNWLSGVSRRVSWTCHIILDQDHLSVIAAGSLHSLNTDPMSPPHPIPPLFYLSFSSFETAIISRPPHTPILCLFTAYKFEYHQMIPKESHIRLFRVFSDKWSS